MPPDRVWDIESKMMNSTSGGGRTRRGKCDLLFEMRSGHLGKAGPKTSPTAYYLLLPLDNVQERSRMGPDSRSSSRSTRDSMLWGAQTRGQPELYMLFIVWYEDVCANPSTTGLAMSPGRSRSPGASHKSSRAAVPLFASTYCRSKYRTEGNECKNHVCCKRHFQISLFSWQL